MAYDDESPYPTSNFPTPGVNDRQDPPVPGENTYLPQIIEPGTQAPATGGGGFDLSGFLGSLFGGGGGLNLSSLLPALASAGQMYHNAGKYGDLAERASQMASPVSTETRQKYQDRLNLLYTDPMKFLEGNPEFMANRRLGEAALFAKNNARGLGDSGKADTDQLRFLNDLGATHINQERDFLSKAGGFQFDPANAAQILQKGGDQEIQAQTAALASLLYPLGAGAGGNGQGGGGGGGLLDQIMGMFKGQGGGATTLPPGLMQIIQAGGPQAIQLATSLMDKGITSITNPDGSVSDLGGFLRMGGQQDGGNPNMFYPTDLRTLYEYLNGGPMETISEAPLATFPELEDFDFSSLFED